MGYHTFAAEKAEKLEQAASRYRYLSTEELVWSISSTETEIVADLGSGTGFYTDDVAEHAERVYGVDVQEQMHEFYREKGVPENVELVTAGVDDLPFDENELDGAFSTMTYHEFAGEDALAEIERVIRSGGHIVIADWSAEGSGEAGPPLDERFTAKQVATDFRDVGFEVEFQASRVETFLLIAHAP